MPTQEQYQALLQQIKVVRKLQKRFFKGEKTVLPLARIEEDRLDFLISDMESTQVKLFDNAG